MTPEQLDVIKKSINLELKNGIETHVNGKIRKLHEKIDVYIKEDNEWKERANPVIEMGNNVRGFGKVVVYLLGICATLFALIKSIK